ncbi:Na(+)/H(+) antiporter subunit B [Arsenicitalea aurantiaca]|uniref:Na(+)/H(+) antiporter subunit B n=1 Tax=Arsenicitalea aurantiaca TaxID=1783274 RepID=A0A433X2R5_9HYPH|nr:MnhB domain-containing protein [Arsenicitalea aurantiaca]RUT28347.1 Na(+)/H(+) antiporter subunit B [Arsenicitalea aurantiaca]
MSSIIFSAMARLFFWAMLAVSIFILYRGHDEPGGGFVGGLVAACSVAILALADGVPSARGMIRVHPVILVGIGLVLAIVSGLPGLVLDASFLTHQWLEFPNGFKLGTTMIFDLGVYLVVFGGFLSLVFRLYEEVS